MENHDLNDLGLSADLALWQQSPLNRRRILQIGALGIGALLAAACQPMGGPMGGPPADNGSASAMPTGTSDCLVTIPGETAGPYPADGSNASNQQLNALEREGIVRSDLRTSLSTQNVAEGVPMTLELTLVNTNGDCAALAGYAIYAWHCTRGGEYSMYSEAIADEDFLRGVQATDSEGKATFVTIFPGCYLGRWPHVHFEIYSSLAEATGSSNVVHTSQLGLPEANCREAYTADGYGDSVKNLAQITLDTDNVFSDGYAAQIATVIGNATDGYTAKLTVGIAV